MSSLILKTTARILLIWILLFSGWVLFRGHNAPGGGFIGGLIASLAFSLYHLAYGSRRLLLLIRFAPKLWLCFGIFLLLISSLPGLFFKKALLSHVAVKIPVFIFSTALIFDMGIYIMVCFSVLYILLAMEHSL